MSLPPPPLGRFGGVRKGNGKFRCRDTPIVLREGAYMGAIRGRWVLCCYGWPLMQLMIEPESTTNLYKFPAGTQFVGNPGVPEKLFFTI
jgi:hypothetical protein